MPDFCLDKSGNMQTGPQGPLSVSLRILDTPYALEHILEIITAYLVAMPFELKDTEVKKSQLTTYPLFRFNVKST